MADTMPWYKSQVLIGAAISLILKVLVLAGVASDLAPEHQAELTNTVVLVLSGLGDLWAMRARVVQTSAPTLTLRK